MSVRCGSMLTRILSRPANLILASIAQNKASALKITSVWFLGASRSRHPVDFRSPASFGGGPERFSHQKL